MPFTPIPAGSSPIGPSYRLTPRAIGSPLSLPRKQDWIMGKEVASLSHGGRNDLICLTFTDGSWIQAKGPNYLGLDSSAWRRRYGADWYALVIMGATAMNTERRVNLLLEGDEVIGWTLN